MVDTQISLKYIIDIIKRNILLARNIFGSGIIISLMLLVFLEKKWVGEFQIVIQKSESQKSGIIDNLSSNQALQSLTALDSITSNKINTELGILKSPSVLLPIFNYFKEYKNKSQKNYDDLSFKAWKEEYLKIKLDRGTTILNVQYFDNDKEKIIKILDKISSAYQFYSNEDFNEDLKLDTEYIIQQLKIYEKKYLESYDKLIQFSKKYDLPINQNIKDNSNELSLLPLGFNLNQNNTSLLTDFNKERNIEANKIRFIKEKINKFNNLKNDDEFVITFAFNYPKIAESELLQQISKINLKLSKLQALFKSNDESITLLKIEKVKLVDKLRNLIINNLNTTKVIAEARLKSIERPNDVIVEFNKIQRANKSDLKILSSLESNLKNLRLLKAKYKAPWELITKPTVSKDPIFPDKKYILTFGIILSLFVTLLTVLIKNYYDENIYSEDDLKNIVGCDVFNFAEFKNEKDFISGIELLFKNNFAKYDLSNIVIFKVGKINEANFSFIKNYCEEKSISIIDKISNLKVNKNISIIYMVSISNINQSDMIKSKKFLSLSNKKAIGCLAI